MILSLFFPKIYSLKLESIFCLTASLILTFGTTALAFLILLIMDFSNFKEKFGLATSCIKTFEIPLTLIKYFKEYDKARLKLQHAGAMLTRSFNLEKSKR